MQRGDYREPVAVLLGIVTSTSIGSLFLQAMGSIALGILGGIGGWIFHKYVKPKLDKITNKKAE